MKVLRNILLGAIIVCVTTATACAQMQEISDKQITNALDLKLLVDEYVPSHLIDVTTYDGIVTLSGSVNQILAKERAERIAEKIKGVRSIVNEIEVKPATRSDKEVREDVKKALFVDPATDSYEVEASVENGLVTLTGTVQSWAEKTLSSEVAKGVKGVRGIENNIEITYKTQRTDSEIKNDIMQRLKYKPFINDEALSVDVKNGNVSFKGTVGSIDERRQVYMIAWVSGVKNVKTDGVSIDWLRSDAMVRDTATMNLLDGTIREAVQDAFLYDPRVNMFNIDVEVDNGVVTLRGVVDNYRAKKSAEEDAENTLGVWFVNNSIKVRPKTLFSDIDLMTEVEQALQRDPIVDRFDITMFIQNGKVFLYGDVNTSYQKMRATNVVSLVPGVVEVQNFIDVRATWTWKNDSIIQKDIENALFWNFAVDEDSISVSVENGTATLTGNVNTWYAHNEAVDAAFDGGANVVNNLLRVEGSAYYYPTYYYRDTHYKV